jgi:LysR family nitrogen assimilation transcriptional regulator
MTILRNDDLQALAQQGAGVDVPTLPMVELRQLHHLAVLASCQSISAAAAQLGIAQPSLSELLIRMEARLGIKLLIRQGRGIQMTEAGLQLALRARTLLADVEAALNDSRAYDQDTKGSVTIGIPPSLGMILSVSLAETVQAELPGVKLHIVEGLSGDLIDWVASGRLDLGCVLGGGVSGSLHQERIASEELFLVTATDNWDGAFDTEGFAIDPVAVGDLHRYPMAMPSSRHGARREVEQMLRSAGGRITVNVEIDSLPQIIALVDRASAYAILPHAAVLQYLSSGRLALVRTAPRLERSIYTIRDRGRPLSRAAGAVESMIKVIMREAIERHSLQAKMADD